MSAPSAPQPHHDPRPDTRPDPRSTPSASGGSLPGGGLASPERAYGNAVQSLANAAWQILATAGLVAIVVGIIVLVWPHATLAVIGVLFGIYLLISGLFQLAGAFGSHVPGSMRAVGFVSGALSVLLGLICFRGAAESTLLLALWIGFGWLLQGVMLTAMALAHDELPARGWQIFLGVITALAGIVLIVSPFGSLTVLAVVSGIWLVVIGAVGVVHAVQLRSLNRPHASRQA
ncbi:HdeD family acid-resistance protein [Streptacidiphilus cavernicola]|uniref:HdeD family acid-resistance protein n=1 Tax=Streptacidiphilus cavernicola TaxID=3342716 RepID=A0ABV6W5W6_9ACTN